MSDKTFVDTNIMVYAYDLDAGAKRDAALERVKDLRPLQNPPKIVIEERELNELSYDRILLK
jgi:predicted nucleic acid-binding protein